jgi:hypothetical protein|tara:strand:+ start:4799 stop:5125 length:327 start_codon:yes stop_codon:yes gene_type:complete
MEKFLSIPVTNEGNQLVSCNDVKCVEIGDENGANLTTHVAIFYGSGKVVDITFTPAVAGGSVAMRTSVQDALEAALSTSWVNVAYDYQPSVVSNTAATMVSISGIDIS